jgi:6-phosphogluconolactonase
VIGIPTLPETAVVYDSPEDLAQAAATWLVRYAATSTGPFSVCLAGGSTPRRMYELIAGASLSNLFPWERAHWFWGDERWVPHNHARSNYHMATEAMLKHAPVPPDHIHPIPFREDRSPDWAAAEYDGALRAFAASRPGAPLFDVVLLGLGEDGHLASLFPGSPALTRRDVLACSAIGPDNEPRVTLTYPAIEDNADVAFLVSGSSKQNALRAVWNGEDLPAAALKPKGTVRWLVDASAVVPKLSR